LQEFLSFVEKVLIAVAMEMTKPAVFELLKTSEDLEFVPRLETDRSN
jgi:hypothetical protein